MNSPRSISAIDSSSSQFLFRRELEGLFVFAQEYRDRFTFSQGFALDDDLSVHDGASSNLHIQLWYSQDSAVSQAAAPSAHRVIGVTS